ncbi:unnamed protein product [Dibothriocephalus latus]|uniref:Glycolipid transfer protein domain-containing protein n=1 Tax=Dibothriocephalus latus TaxID=60516 RepID=A0A3P7R069_DIBLA|nr:unnamed protein product [Dibothriocephalus latus]
MSAKQANTFNLKLVIERFTKAVSYHLISPSNLLFSLLDELGRIMYFVMRDVSKKLDILNKLRDPTATPEYHENFITVNKMCSFEKNQYEDNKPVGKLHTYGARNLLRLHRALIFIISFFEKVCIGKCFI